MKAIILTFTPFLLLVLVGCFSHSSTCKQSQERIIERLTYEMSLNSVQTGKLKEALEALPQSKERQLNVAHFFASAKFDSDAALAEVDALYKETIAGLETALPLVALFFDSLSDEQKEIFIEKVVSRWQDQSRNSSRCWFRS